MRSEKGSLMGAVWLSLCWEGCSWPHQGEWHHFMASGEKLLMAFAL